MNEFSRLMSTPAAGAAVVLVPLERDAALAEKPTTAARAKPEMIARMFMTVSL
jgi:hypothetical protein